MKKKTINIIVLLILFNSNYIFSQYKFNNKDSVLIKYFLAIDSSLTFKKINQEYIKKNRINDFFSTKQIYFESIDTINYFGIACNLFSEVPIEEYTFVDVSFFVFNQKLRILYLYPGFDFGKPVKKKYQLVACWSSIRNYNVFNYKHNLIREIVWDFPYHNIEKPVHCTDYRRSKNGYEAIERGCFYLPVRINEINTIGQLLSFSEFLNQDLNKNWKASPITGIIISKIDKTNNK